VVEEVILVEVKGGKGRNWRVYKIISVVSDNTIGHGNYAVVNGFITRYIINVRSGFVVHSCEWCYHLMSGFIRLQSGGNGRLKMTVYDYLRLSTIIVLYYVRWLSMMVYDYLFEWCSNIYGFLKENALVVIEPHYIFQRCSFHMLSKISHWKLICFLENRSILGVFLGKGKYLILNN